MAELGLDFEELLQQEEEPGLGNGGLGRLAACFIDSLATLEVPSVGYGIRYEFGIFHQEIVDGWQVEKTDKWLRFGNPWELVRPEWAVEVKLGGTVEQYIDERNRQRVRWVPHKTVMGVPYDTPILGYRTNTANTLRLWRSEATRVLRLRGLQPRRLLRRRQPKSRVREPEQGALSERRAGARQGAAPGTAIFSSCPAPCRTCCASCARRKLPVDQFHVKFAVQLNDTHPAIAIAELMRLLVDEALLPWAEAWKVTRRTFAYTNHTLLPEALERWPLAVFGRVLPRHLQIIHEINAQFLEEVRIRFLGDEARIARLSLIDETGERYVRMAHLACVGSHAINGVAELHSELLKRDVLKDFYELWPEKFSNKTNGVTPRRWMVLSNPKLSELITGHIGAGWIKDLAQLRALEPLAENPEFRSPMARDQAAQQAGIRRPRPGSAPASRSTRAPCSMSW